MNRTPRLDRNQRRLLRELASADDLIEKNEHAEGRRIMLASREAARRDGLPHGTLSWRIAIVCDWMHDLEEAMKFIVEALEQDPLALPFRRSFDIIASRLRRALADEDRAPSDPSTPRLYRLLVQVDEADEHAHVAMARWHMHRGQAEQAHRLLDALTVLAPTFGAGWEARAEAARLLGRSEEASACEIEARACRGERSPLFAIPGKATA